MNKKAHIVGGACAGVMASSILVENSFSANGLLCSSMIIASSVWGSLAPDIDHPGSTFGSKIKPLSKLISATGGHRGITHAPLIWSMILAVMLIISEDLFQFAIILSLGYYLCGLVSTMCKKLKFIKQTIILKLILFVIFLAGSVMFSVYMPLIYSLSLIGIFVGALSHIFMDSLTKGGTPWLYPISKRKFRILKLKTGEHEWIGILIVILITFIFLYVRK